MYVSAPSAESECYSQSLGVQNGDYLLIALGAGSNQLLKVNASVAFVPPLEVQVNENAGVLSQLDALILSEGGSPTLFAVGNGVNSIFALTSSDDWVTATLRATYNANCPKFQPSAIALVDDEDLVCYCTNGFGPAPYPLTVLTKASGEYN